jgi:hypothetical protein
MRAWRLLALVIVLSGCASAPKMAWVRTDGQSLKTDPVLVQQFEIDRTICQGELQKANLSGVVIDDGDVYSAVARQNRSIAASQVRSGCMAEKGYIQTPEDQAEAKRQEFAAVAAEKARREALPNGKPQPPTRKQPQSPPKPIPQPASSQ